MELRRAADVFLRPQSSPLTSLLNPASQSRWGAGTQLCYRNAGNRPAQRALASSAINHSQKLQATTTATPTENNGSDAPSIEEVSRSLWTAPNPRSSKPTTTLDLEREKRMNGGSSAVDILAALNAAGSSKPYSKFDSSRMLDPLNSSKSMMNEMGASLRMSLQTPKIPMRLTPSTGRSITIGTGIDVARGLRLLEQSCARNRVRSDATAQRFHERGGLKRKRLRRQRWRKKFMEGFKATVGRVKQLKNQGW